MLWYDRIDVSKGIYIKVHQNSVTFATVGIFEINELSFKRTSAMIVMIY